MQPRFSPNDSRFIVEFTLKIPMKKNSRLVNYFISPVRAVPLPQIPHLSFRALNTDVCRRLCEGIRTSPFGQLLAETSDLNRKRRSNRSSYQFVSIVMESTVDALNNAYQEFVAAAAGVLEAKELTGGQKTAATDAALEKFKQQWELFRVACDQAEEFVESVKQRIGSECLVDEATGSVAVKPGQSTASLPPISAVRLEQMSKAVRWLVLELQHGPGTANSSHSHSTAPFDSRFSEDAPQ